MDRRFPRQQPPLFSSNSTADRIAIAFPSGHRVIAEGEPARKIARVVETALAVGVVLALLAAVHDANRQPRRR